MKEEPLCVIHPGFMDSKNDGQWHFISYEQLIKLYHLDPKKCFNAELEDAMNGRRNCKHYYPRYDGEYK